MFELGHFPCSFYATSVCVAMYCDTVWLVFFSWILKSEMKTVIVCMRDYHTQTVCALGRGVHHPVKWVESWLSIFNRPIRVSVSLLQLFRESKVYDKTSISIPCFYVETVCGLHNIVNVVPWVCVCASVCTHVLVFVYNMYVFLLLWYDILIAWLYAYRMCTRTQTLSCESTVVV